MTPSSVLERPAATSAALNPNRIIEMVMNYRASKVLLVAVYYDVFTAIQQGYRTPTTLSDHISTDARATKLLLEALVSLDYLKTDGAAFANTPISETYLVRGKPDYLGNNLKYQEMIWDAWSDLRNVLKRGRPKNILKDWLKNEAFTRDYIQGMANIAERPAAEIVALLKGHSIRSILDVGAGPGAYTLSFLKAYPLAYGTLLDLPTTILLTKDLLKHRLESHRIQYKPGSYHTTPFGESQYDVVILSHITHDEGAQQNLKLIRKAYKSLRPGGKIVVHDFMSDDNTVPSAFLSLFSVHMLVYTKDGRVYSAQTYKKWLEEAGFKELEVHDIAKELPNRSKALIGTR